MESNTKSRNAHPPHTTIPSEIWLDDGQGHQRLTRRMIEEYPENHFFSYSIGGMRPFSAFVTGIDPPPFWER